MCLTVQLSRFFVLSQQLVYIITSRFACQELFSSFSSFFFNPQNSKRRRRDLNPRAAINDLLPFQGSPFGQLGYFSKLPQMLSSVYQKRYLLYNIFFHFVKHYFNFFYKFFICLTNGESGIRTHAPLRTNGFQDRLVMTTSIPLQLILNCALSF